MNLDVRVMPNSYHLSTKNPFRFIHTVNFLDLAPESGSGYHNRRFISSEIMAKVKVFHPELRFNTSTLFIAPKLDVMEILTYYNLNIRKGLQSLSKMFDSSGIRHEPGSVSTTGHSSKTLKVSRSFSTKVE